MRWIESPPYFCSTLETARDVAEQYLQLPLDTMKPHKFLPWTELSEDFSHLPPSVDTVPFRFLLEIYMDDYIGLAIPTLRPQLQHYSNVMMYGIHDVFPPDTNDNDDPISFLKLKQGNGSWALVKDILGLTFNGTNKTVWLKGNKQKAI